MLLSLLSKKSTPMFLNFRDLLFFEAVLFLFPDFFFLADPGLTAVLGLKTLFY